MHISPWNRYQPCHSPNWCPSEMDINPPWLVTSHITSWTLHLVTHTYISWTKENINKNIGISWVSYSGIYTTSTLKASRMNVNPGGSQAQMRDGWFQQNGKRIIQPMIFPADHPTFPNQPKGLWHVLAKWGIDTWHLSCGKCKKCELPGDAPSHTSAVPDSTPPLGWNTAPLCFSSQNSTPLPFPNSTLASSQSPTPLSLLELPWMWNSSHTYTQGWLEVCIVQGQCTLSNDPDCSRV